MQETHKHTQGKSLVVPEIHCFILSTEEERSLEVHQRGRRDAQR